MEQLQPWQVVLAFGVVAFIGLMILIWGDRPELYAAIRRRFEERRAMSSDGRLVAPPAPVQDLPSPVVLNERTEPLNVGAEAFICQEEPRTGGAVFVLSEDELLAVQMMIVYRDRVLASGEKPTKSNAILAGFGLKRGGSARYLRASEVYDRLFGEPDPAVKFPALTAARRAGVES